MSAPDNTLTLTLTLRPSAVLDQVVASRVKENIGQVPVPVKKLDQRQVEQIATPDLVAGLGRFKGIDVSSFSTRGFNSSRSERVILLVDHMDTQLPLLNSFFGNLLGSPVLDVVSGEIVHGPASALYGCTSGRCSIASISRTKKAVPKKPRPWLGWGFLPGIYPAPGRAGRRGRKGWCATCKRPVVSFSIS